MKGRAVYRTSDEPRFARKREVLQRAFIDLTLERKTSRLSIKELAERAGVNRMTFYSHYDEVPDILAEFIDDLRAKIMMACEDDEGLSIRALFESATASMQEEIEFYRLVAREEGFELYRATFRNAFTSIFVEELRKSTQLEGAELDLLADMIASGITYAYLDWLAGKYGELPLERLVALCERFVLNAQTSILAN